MKPDSDIILMAVIGAFLLFTGVSYLLQQRKKEETSKRGKAVSITLIISGLLMALIPLAIPSMWSDNNDEESTQIRSKLLGPESFDREMMRNPQNHSDAAELYGQAISFYNMDKNGFDSANYVLELLDKSIALYETAEAYTTRGQLKIQMGMVRDALADLDESIALNPAYGNAYFHKGALYYITGDNPQACLNFKKADSLGVPGASDAKGTVCR